MQLKEILDENTVSAINKKTNIAEDNIVTLSNGEFEKISRVKTMGFLSILEREFHVDLSRLREEADTYYNSHTTEESVTIGLPMPEAKKGKSKWLTLVVVLLIVYAVWYAFNNFDKEKLGEMLPFSEETLSKLIMPSKTDANNDHNVLSELGIESVTTSKTTTLEETSSLENNSSY